MLNCVMRRLESLSNPLLGVADLPALIALGHQVGATVVVDSTFTTPVLQRPLQLGADIVMHSVTKYIGGHSDLLMGALVAADDTVAEVRRLAPLLFDNIQLLTSVLSTG